MAESFRDIIYTSDAEGHRKWVYAEKPRGKFYTARTLVSLVYLIVFFTLPFLRSHGEPLFLFDVIHRKFILFGFIFWPQDFFIFAIGMLTFIIFIVFFTVIYGRVFCGWACPQTVFMEMVFRRIEYWIEGSASRQKKLDAQPWNREKILKKTLKHAIFFGIAVLIANTFLAYVIGVKPLIKLVTDPVGRHIGGFFAMLAFSGAFYGVFAFLREQVCTFACPYGRLQGVLLDKSSLVVAYDYRRGEPRGHIGKKSEVLPGDCVDCSLCVKVCPTGIDIRNGTQLECVNCTACIDACNTVMEKVHRPKGLIRYASENHIASGSRFRFTGRMLAYSVVLLILMGALSVMLITRKPVTATITRAQGQLYQKTDSLHFSNLYNIRLANKTHEELPVSLRVEDLEGSIKVVGDKIHVGKESLAESTFFIELNAKDLHKMKTPLRVGVYSGDKKIATVKTTFFSPVIH